MFEFLDMANNYEQRKIDRYQKDDLMVSTAMVNDSDKPFETAIRHLAYNDDKIVIVQTYDSKEEAQEGHNLWVKVMTNKNLPELLTDVSTAKIMKFREMLGQPEKRFVRNLGDN